MTTVATAIETKIAQLMAAATSLSSLDIIILGLPYDVLAQYDRYAVVVVDSEAVVREWTGNRVLRGYQGAIIINVRQPDLTLTSVEEGIAQVPSHSTVQDLVNATVVLLRTTGNLDLGAMPVTNGVVQRIQVGQQIEYGLAYSQERQNAYGTSGIIPFVVEAAETMP